MIRSIVLLVLLIKACSFLNTRTTSKQAFLVRPAYSYPSKLSYSSLVSRYVPLKLSATACFIPDCSLGEYEEATKHILTAHNICLRLYSHNENVSEDPAITSASNAIDYLLDVQYLPNIYEMNDKRYEIKWINYMRNINLQRYDLVVAEKSSSEAVMRFLESEKLNAAILLDSPEFYTAGERHGRDFRFSLIYDNCPTVLYAKKLMDREEYQLIDSLGMLPEEIVNFEESEDGKLSESSNTIGFGVNMVIPKKLAIVESSEEKEIEWIKIVLK